MDFLLCKYKKNDIPSGCESTNTPLGCESKLALMNSPLGCESKLALMNSPLGCESMNTSYNNNIRLFHPDLQNKIS